MKCIQRNCDCPERLQQEKDLANISLDILKEMLLNRQAILTHKFINNQPEGTIIQEGLKRYSTPEIDKLYNLD